MLWLEQGLDIEGSDHVLFVMAVFQRRYSFSRFLNRLEVSAGNLSVGSVPLMMSGQQWWALILLVFFQPSFFSTAHQHKRTNGWFRREKTFPPLPLCRATAFLVLLSEYGEIRSLTNEASPWPRVSHFRKHESAAYYLTAEQHCILGIGKWCALSITDTIFPSR